MDWNYTKADAYFGGRLPGGVSPEEARMVLGSTGDVRAGAVVAGVILLAFLAFGGD